MEATYITHLTNAGDQTTYNFGNVTVPSDGLVIVVASSVLTYVRSIASVSIGGTNGTIVKSIGSNIIPMAIACREVTAGDRNITVVMSDWSERCSAAVWLLTGYNSATPYATANNSGGAASYALSMNYATDGIGIYGANIGGSNAFTYVGGTKRTDVAVESKRFSGGDRTASGAGVSQTFSWGGVMDYSVIGASWEPSAGPTGPTITTGASQSVQESTTAVCTMAADGDTPITWSLTGGTDEAFFDIDADTGALSFLSARDYETPEDANADNVYSVEVTATNSGGSDALTVNVTVTNEGGSGGAAGINCSPLIR